MRTRTLVVAAAMAAVMAVPFSAQSPIDPAINDTIFGATETASRATGGTDSTSFNNAGLPGIGFGQDPIEYGSRTWHTNLDTYERVVEQDVREAAIVVAATLYQLAMRPDPLPRFVPDKMPPPPQRGRGGRQHP